MEKKVDFIICGTQKGGTTALDAYLRTHPELCMANKKEVLFFDNEKEFQNSTPNYASYHSFFNPQPSHKLIGEATPIYMFWHEAPKRIWQYNPNMKLIVMLRNPIDRAYSSWNQWRSKNLDTASFWDAITHEESRCKEALPLQHTIYSYIARGMYVEQLQRLWDYFPKEQVLIIKSAALKQQPNQTLKKIHEFLGVTFLPVATALSVHARTYPAPMSKQERDYLTAIFEPEIKALEKVLDWDCSDWLKV